MTKEEYNKNRPKIKCSLCGKEISKPCFERHFKACSNLDSVLNEKRKKKIYHVSHDGLNCKFCNKLCKNLNSLTQHEIRCKYNSNRIESANRDFKSQYKNLPQEVKDKMAWSRGFTTQTHLSIKKQIENRPKTHPFEDIYSEHNSKEINKWVEYIKTLDIQIPNYEVYFQGKENTDGYKIIKKHYRKENNTVKILFEHNYIANLYLNGNLKSHNTVHHVDMNPGNNNINNLIIFETNKEHKRFHNSKYAWLVYNEETHKFNCILKKDNNIQ